MQSTPLTSTDPGPCIFMFLMMTLFALTSKPPISFAPGIPIIVLFAATATLVVTSTPTVPDT